MTLIKARGIEPGHSKFVMKSLTSSIGRCLAIALLAMSVSSPAWAVGNIDKGRQFVERNCARCHAIDLDDDSHMPEAPPLRTLHTRYPIDSLTEAFAEGIVTGHPQMPEFQLDTDTISDMLAYIKSLSGTGQ